jgi:hypothetical protein
LPATFSLQNNDNSSAPLSVDSIVINNAGYNPVGTIANPWHPSGALTNDGGGTADPVSGRLYTIRQSPKTIIISGGALSQLATDGTPTGLTAGVFKLGIGETIAVTYSSVPLSTVSASPWSPLKGGFAGPTRALTHHQPGLS